MHPKSGAKVQKIIGLYKFLGRETFKKVNFAGEMNKKLMKTSCGEGTFCGKTFCAQGTFKGERFAGQHVF